MDLDLFLSAQLIQMMLISQDTQLGSFCPGVPQGTRKGRLYAYTDRIKLL